MEEDLKTLETILLQNNKSHIQKEIEKIQTHWIEEANKIDTEISWDDLAEAEEAFLNLRQKDIETIKYMLMQCSLITEDDITINKQEQTVIKQEQTVIKQEQTLTDDEVKVYRPIKLYGDLPGVKKGNRIQTSKVIEQTQSIREESAKYEVYNKYELITDVMKLIRDIHQSDTYIKWLQENYTSNTQKHKTLNNLPKFMTASHYNISNKTRIESIKTILNIINTKQYNKINIYYKSKDNFKINLYEEILKQVIFIIHTRMNNDNIDKILCMYHLIHKNDNNTFTFLKSKKIDVDKYCLCV